MNKKGSALLLVICVMSMLLFTIATIWRGSVFVYELALARQEYEQHYWNSSALMTWAIALCKENFDHFLKYTEHSQQEVTIKKWPPTSKGLRDKKSYGASIMLSKKDADQIAIQTSLKNQPKEMVFKCTLKRAKNKDHEELFFIQDWSMT